MPALVQRWPLWRMTFSVFLPFAAAYYLSYLFRTINAVSAPRMSSDVRIGAAELGLLTAVYFLTSPLRSCQLASRLNVSGRAVSRSSCCLWLFRGQSYSPPLTIW